MKMPMLVVLLITAPLALAEPVTGPVIDDHGPVYYAPEQPVTLSPGETLRVVFDVAAAPDEYSMGNHRLETAARFLNLNARAGVPASEMRVEIVLHGRATRAALADDAFEARYGASPPDTALLEALADAGVNIYVCGQSAAAYGFAPEELRPGAILSPSAMTALVRLQSAGYALIPWGTR